MTSIAFKNGLPVALQPSAGSDFVLVAANVACCPDSCPEICWDCLDDCAYIFSVTAPSELAVSARGGKCGLQLQDFDSASTDFMYESLFPEGTDSGPRAGDTYLSHLSFSQAGAPIAFLGAEYPAGAAVQHSGHGWVSLEEDGCSPLDTRVFLDAGVVFTLGCQTHKRPSPFYVFVEAFVSASVYQSVLGSTGAEPGSCSGFWTWRVRGRFEVPSTCGSYPDRQCIPPLANQDFRIVDTPFSFTATGNETTLGSYSETEGPTTGGTSAAYIAIATTMGEAMRDALSATFEIDARETCASLEVCCCSADGVSEILEDEGCDGTTSPVADPAVDLEDITILVDWDGLTITLESPYFSGSTSEGVSFSCARPGEDPFEITERNFSANFSPQSSGDCVYFTSNINAFFINTETFQSAQSNTIGPYVGECKLNAPTDETDTSCDFGESASWCPDHPYANSVTVQMIIAP